MTHALLSPAEANSAPMYSEAHLRVGAALQEAYTVSAFAADPEGVEAALERQRQELRRAVHAGIQARPEATESLTNCGQLLEYLWYGRSDDAPPPSLGVDRGGELVVDRSIIDDSAFGGAMYFLRQYGLGSILRARDHNLYSARDSLKETVASVVEESAGNQVLSAFALEVPQTAERLLNTLERAGREAEVRFQTAGAHRSAQRKPLNRLENETRPDRQPSQQDGFDSARAFFRQMVAGRPDEDVSDILYRGHQVCTIDGRAYDLQAVLAPLIDSSVSVHLLKRALTGLFEQPTPPETYEQWVGYMANQEEKDILDRVSRDAQSLNALEAGIKLMKRPPADALRYVPEYEPQIRPSGLEDAGKSKADDTDSQLIYVEGESQTDASSELQSSGIEGPGEGSQAGTNHESQPRTSTYLSKEEYEAQKKQTTGRVTRAATKDRRSRMLLPGGELPADIAELDPDYTDLIIHIEDRTAGAFHVPGYQLTGYNPITNEYGFRRISGHDPYTQCTTVLTNDQRTGAAQVAVRAGLPALATDIESNPILSVSGLKDLIRQYAGKYYLPAEGDPDAGAVFDTPSTPEDLQVFVSDGRFKLQCDNAYEVCRVFFQEAKIGTVGEPLHGTHFTPKKGDRLTGILHAQMPFIDADGKYYILDATPEAQGATQSIKALGRTMLEQTARLTESAKGLVSRALSAVAMRQKGMGAEEVAGAGESPEDRLQAQLMANRNELVAQLGRAMHVAGAPMHPDDVLRSVAKRPRTDLIRLVAELVENTVPFHNTPAEDSTISHGRAVWVLDYIRDLRTNPQIVRDPHGYATRSSMLALLEKSLRRVEDLTRPPKPNS